MKKKHTEFWIVWGGGSWLTELCVLSCWMISSDLGHLDSHLSFSYSESFGSNEKFNSWLGWNVAEMYGGLTSIHFLSNAIWEE